MEIWSHMNDRYASQHDRCAYQPEARHLPSIPAAAASGLQLQLQQHLFESIHNVKLPIYTKFGNHE